MDRAAFESHGRRIPAPIASQRALTQSAHKCRYRSDLIRHDAQVTDFVGVSSDPGWGVTGRGTASPGLYEFKTDLGVPVRLHDATFLGFDFRVGARESGAVQSLTTRFVYDDPEWTPPEAIAAPFIEFRFDDVHITHWEESPDLEEYANDQVSGFDYHEQDDSFDLQTYTMRLVFVAKRVAVTMHPVSRA